MGFFKTFKEEDSQENQGSSQPDLQALLDQVEIMEPAMAQETVTESENELKPLFPREAEERRTQEREENAMASFASKSSDSEPSIIAEGTTITGTIESDCAIEIKGAMNGTVKCNGKLTIRGSLKGDSESFEFYADAAKVEGEIRTEGAAKIGMNSVILGNIHASTAVIAGSVKGDIDVPGLVVIDGSAIIIGNVKSLSVQINNGAVIQGFVTQSYANVDVSKMFGEES